MTQEEKRLLLKDLCARLPYGVKAKVDGHINPLQVLGVSKLNKSTWAWKKGTYVVTFWNDTKCIDNIVPYLRSMSSMTEEEENEWREFNIDPLLEAIGKPHTRIEDLLLRAKSQYEPLEWLNAHHFDYRGLIEKGLALEASEGMYKTE